MTALCVGCAHKQLEANEYFNCIVALDEQLGLFIINPQGAVVHW